MYHGRVLDQLPCILMIPCVSQWFFSGFYNFSGVLALTLLLSGFRAEALVAADVNSSWEDRGLTLLASAISLLIALLITRKLYTVSGLEAADYL